jgi:enoyl-CoA hydratase/carnithine racemase
MNCSAGVNAADEDHSKDMQEHLNTAEPAEHVRVERQGHAGLITLNRPKALNAMSLGMVRALKTALEAFAKDPGVQVVAIRGTNKLGKPGSPDGLFGGFCAGGDIRYFHQAALAGDNSLDDFFTEEYRLNHLIHHYPKPFVAFMDGVVMGGGMGISQGASLRLVTEHTRMAMPETIIGLFPDVGGGYFLSRCPGHIGEYLALTGEVIAAQQALQYGLADVQIEAAQQAALWAALGTQTFANRAQVEEWLALQVGPKNTELIRPDAHIDGFFSLLRVKHIVDALEKAKDDRWAQKTAALLRKRSPMMLHVTLEQIRRARQMSLADDLRMERDMVHHCFHERPGTASETVEGIRALAVDKDYAPKWNPARIEDVKPGMADAFFVSPWAQESHPLRDF